MVLEFDYEVRRTALRVEVRVHVKLVGENEEHVFNATATRENEYTDKWTITLFDNRKCIAEIPRGEHEHGYEYLSKVAEYVKAATISALTDYL